MTEQTISAVAGEAPVREAGQEHAAPSALPAETEGAGARAPVGLLGAWLTLLLLVPDRYTLPEGANIAVRPHHAVLAVLLLVVARRFVRGEGVRVGRAAVVLALPAAAGASLLSNLPGLGTAETAAGVRAFGEVCSLALVVLLTATIGPNARQRRALVTLVVGLLVVGSFLGFREAATGRRALDGLDRTVPVLGVETFSATGARATANPFATQPAGFQWRSGRIRVAGPSRHAIEFSVVMAFAVALAAGLAVGSRGARRGLAVAAAASAAAALPLALARSGVVGLAAAAAAAVLVARDRVRTGLLAVAAAGLLVVVVVVAQPAATEALVSVFTQSRDDPSVAARTADYAEIDRAVGTRPWLGLGIGQWESYRTPFGAQLLFDNQYLLSAEETGLLGALALVAVFVAAVSTGLRWCRRAGPERPLAVGVLATLVAFVVVSATFDALYFSQAASLFMFAFGLSCAAVAEEPLA